ncbi:TadG family pilus assembly protein [Novosphingobium sp. 9]|uniref:TadG family pilus assembly protein n=1 Tax=Novosphingobium sp. 9 TaxID=2025349 RepID=UPI0021B6927D|nr:TadG family pilus assembly protein [Novosphingobium sp. 9]
MPFHALPLLGRRFPSLLRAIKARHFHNGIRRLCLDRSGIATMMMAISLIALMGAATVSVDLASMYLAKRNLQGVVDAAAMAAANQGTDAAQRTAINGVVTEAQAANVTIASLQSGTYTASTSVPIAQRFQTGGDGSAARVTLSQQVPLFFARALGFRNGTVTATATAQRQDLVAFSLGTTLATVSGGIPNQLLSALIGTNLNLSVLDSQNLANADVDLLGFADALKAQVNAGDITYAQLFGQSISVGNVIRALAGSVNNSAAASLLSSIAAQAPSKSIAMSNLIDLGPYGQLDYNPGTLGLNIDAYSILRTALELSAGDHYDISLNLSVAGWPAPAYASWADREW